MRVRRRIGTLVRIARLVPLALCLFLLTAALIPPAWAQERAQAVGVGPSGLAPPSRLAERFGRTWAEEFRVQLLSAARRGAVSTLALTITLQSIRLDQLPDDPAEAALFCAKVAGVADVALRSGYSPTLLAADVRQVLRSGSSPAFGPGLVRGPRLYRDRPFVGGPFSAPGPARPAVRGGPGAGGGVQSAGGFGQQ